RASRMWQNLASHGFSYPESINNIFNAFSSREFEEDIFKPGMGETCLFSQLFCSALSEDVSVLEYCETITDRFSDLKHVSTENSRNPVSREAMDKLLDHSGGLRI